MTPNVIFKVRNHVQQVYAANIKVCFKYKNVNYYFHDVSFQNARTQNRVRLVNHSDKFKQIYSDQELIQALYHRYYPHNGAPRFLV